MRKRPPTISDRWALFVSPRVYTWFPDMSLDHCTGSTMHMLLDRYRLGSLDRYADAYYQPQLVLRNAMEASRFDLLTLMHWLMYNI